MERRERQDRRAGDDTSYAGPERRGGRDRRSGKDRRVYRRILAILYGGQSDVVLDLD